MSDTLFIRIPRTGTTSICKALGISHEDHKIWKQWKEKIGEKWDKTFKFSFVREPYDRFISMYCAFYRGEFQIDDFIVKQKYLDDKRFIPQTDYIYDRGKLVVDYLGRFEEMDKSWDELCWLMGRDKIELGHEYPSKRRSTFLTDEQKADIYDYYKNDFHLLGYERR